MLPVVPQAALTYVWPINWCGLHRQYLNVGEMEIIAALLRSVEAKSMIEFGCRDGRTARVLLHNVGSLVRYVGVDVPLSYNPILAHQRAEMVASPGALVVDDPRFELRVLPHGSLDLRAGDERFDCCFIDGDHSEEVVYRDAWRAWTIVRPGGVIIFHDYFNGAVEVQKAVNRLPKEGWQLKHVEGTWLAFAIVGADG